MAIAIGSGQFGLEAAGTDQHQDELEQMAGGRTEAGVDRLCGALLVPNPKNPYDPNAIAVVINSLVVGYVPSNIAPSLKYALRIGGYIAAGCAAKIVGGWARPHGDIGDFSVRLDADWPFKLRPIAKQETPPAPPPVFNAPPAFNPQPRPTPPPVAAPPVAPAAPRVETRPFAEEDEVPHELVEEPRRKRSIVAILIDLVLIVALLGAGYWWVQRLPRAPQQPPPTAAPAAPEPAPAAEPAPPPQPQPFQWPDPPPQFQAPPQAAPPPAPTEPQAAPAPAPAPPPAAPPPAAKKPAPKKPATPKAPPPNAPLKIN